MLMQRFLDVQTELSDLNSPAPLRDLETFDGVHYVGNQIGGLFHMVKSAMGERAAGSLS
jgi:hypothetical protein